MISEVCCAFDFQALFYLFLSVIFRFYFRSGFLSRHLKGVLFQVFFFREMKTDYYCREKMVTLFLIAHMLWKPDNLDLQTDPTLSSTPPFQP